MSDPFSGADSAPQTNAAEYTVSELSGALKRTVEDRFGNVRVRGEISGYRGPHSSGHAYFALKDERSRLEAVIWKGTFSRLKFRPEEGMEVVASGKLTTYPGSSKYQIVIDNLEPAGAGALMALLEERRRKLAAEGLFDDDRKRPLPFMPRVIGVVTSPTGAVIRDIVHRISDRFPLHVVVWPVRVQGETAGAEVAAAVAGFNALDPLGPATPMLVRALDSAASGQEVAFMGGVIRVLGTYPTEHGPCRSFAIESATPVTAIACREGDLWRTRIAVARPITPDGFTPAAGEDPLLRALLERSGAGAALGTEAERAAIERGWR